MSKKIEKLAKGQIKELRGAYGGPIGDSVNVPVSKADLKLFGELACKYIEQEARKAARYSTALPKDEKFFKSFTYRIVGEKTVKIVSDWPWIQIYQNLQDQAQTGEKDMAFGKPRPFRLTKLTRSAGVHKVPMVDKKTGQVIVRTAPLKAADAWIHPGIARHTFVNKGMLRARKEFVQELVNRNVGKILGGS